MLPNWATECMLGALLGALAFHPSYSGRHTFTHVL